MQQRVEFVVADENGKPVRVRVRKPNRDDRRSARVAAKVAFDEAVRGGAPRLEEFEVLVAERGLWDDAKKAVYDALQRGLVADAEALTRVPVEEGRNIAVRMRLTRNEARRLRQPYHELQLRTAEASALQAKFNHFVVACTTYAASGRRVWDSVEAYRRQSGQPLWERASWAMGNLEHGVHSSFESNLPEEKFLGRHGLPAPA